MNAPTAALCAHKIPELRKSRAEAVNTNDGSFGAEDTVESGENAVDSARKTTE